MKRITATLLLLAVLLLTMGAIISSIDLQVSLINQEPDPVAPGSTVDVRFRIENEGGAPAKNVLVKLVPDYPFSLYSDAEEYNVGSITGGQTDDLGVRQKFTLKVDANAAPGAGTVEFWYKVENGPWVKAGDYTITVQSRDAVLAISSISTTPSPIVPGSTTKVTFTLDNFAGTSLADVNLNLGLLRTYVTSTGYSEQELPFTPVGSGNERTLKRIPTGERASISFDLFTDADAVAKAYKVPFTLSYEDTSGTNFTRSGIVGLVVDPKPDVSMTLDSSTIVADGQKGTVSVRFVNKGFSDVKFLTVTLKETTEFDLISNKEVYIGELDSDDYETADYTLVATKGGAGIVDLPFQVEYRDANGEAFVQEVSLPLNLFSGKQLKARTASKGNNGVGILIVLVIVIGGVWLYRRRKKKHAA